MSETAPVREQPEADKDAFTFRMAVDGYGSAELVGSRAFLDDATAAISVLTMAFLAEHVRRETGKGRSLEDIQREFMGKFDAQFAAAMKQVNERPDEQARVAVRVGDDNTPAPRPDVAELVRENEKLSAFKAYVHRRLDEAGVPVDPDSSHKAEGCRIGGRLDIVLAAKPDVGGVNAEVVDALRLIVAAYDKGEIWSDRDDDNPRNLFSVARTALARVTST